MRDHFKIEVYQGTIVSVRSDCPGNRTQTSHADSDGFIHYTSPPVLCVYSTNILEAIECMNILKVGKSRSVEDGFHKD